MGMWRQGRSRGAKAALLLALCALSGCASTSSVFVQARPVAADVYAADGRLLGKSPLTLSGEALRAAAPEGQLRLRLSAPRYETREIWVDSSGSQQVDVVLTPLAADYFNERFVRDFAGEVNDLTRQLLLCQGLLLALRLEEASRAITDLQSRFPNVAAAYVLGANLELLRKQPTRARAQLRRALTLDPQDPAAARLLRQVESEEGRR